MTGVRSSELTSVIVIIIKAWNMRWAECVVRMEKIADTFRFWLHETYFSQRICFEKCSSSLHHQMVHVATCYDFLNVCRSFTPHYLSMECHRPPWTPWRKTQTVNSMLEVFILEEEEGDLGAGSQGARAGSQGAVAVAVPILHTKFCEGRKSWSRVLMLMTL
jgi:hypothetical protein